VSRVIVIDPQARVAQVIVPDYQLSLAIGKEGQNARLAARLTGWKIDIRPDTPAGGPGAGPAPEAAVGPAPEAAVGPVPEAAVRPVPEAAVRPAPEAAAGTADDATRRAGAAGAGHGAADAPAR
jgi:N utilization substance protein A